MSYIGQRFTLWRADYRLDAYADQFGRKHPGYVVSDERLVTVIEERQVKSFYSHRTETAIKAIDEMDLLYTRHWNGFPDDSSSPSFYWDQTENEYGFVWNPVDAVQAFNSGRTGPPYISLAGESIIPVGQGLCPIHLYAFQIDQSSCLGCRSEIGRAQRSRVTVSQLCEEMR